MKKQKGPAFHQAGQTLVEAILSLAVISAVITAVVIAVITSLNGTNYNKDENLALNYAQEGLDVIRDSKSADYDAFMSSLVLINALPSYYCLGKTDIKPTNYSDCSNSKDVNIDAKFTRIIYINQNGNSDSGANKCSIPGLYAASIVRWSDGKCDNSQTQCHQVKLESCFSNTNIVPAP